MRGKLNEAKCINGFVHVERAMNNQRLNENNLAVPILWDRETARFLRSGRWWSVGYGTLR
jgi:hypothetical protein